MIADGCDGVAEHMAEAVRGSCLVLKSAGLFVALPVDHAIETMRPLPVDALAGLPPFVRGVSRIRGEAVPVVDLGALVATRGPAPAGRFVTVRSGGRTIALAVDDVIGVREIGPDDLRDLPPLLRELRNEHVEALGVLDDGLLLVLRTARILAPEVWDRIAKATGGKAR